MSCDVTHSNIINILSRFDLHNGEDKTFLKQISKPPFRFHLTMLLVITGMALFLGVSSMMLVWLENPIGWLKKEHITISYSFQIPITVLVASFLGKRYGTLTILIYLVAGFAGIPIFANGGGIDYINQPSLGYLIGFVFIPTVVQPFLNKAYCNTGWFKGRSIWMIVAAILGVFVVHMTGLIGLGIHAWRGIIDIMEAEQWMMLLSWPVILYDFVFSFIAIASVRIFRALFWFCLY